MTDLTNYGENAAAEALLGTGTYYLSAHTGDPGETGAANELAAANGYARQPSTYTITGDTAVNDTACVFGPATADQGTITHVAVWDAVTAGNCVAKTAVDAPIAWPSGSVTFAAGDVALTLD